jgi:putative endonuclease
MKTSTHQLGRQNEAVAVRYLKRNGYRILDQNCRTACGEIDIVAKDGPVTVFVEVKSRRSDRYGKAKSAVTPAKQARLSKAGLLWLKSHHQMRDRARFDVVAIDHTDKEPRVELIQNAFELKYG